ncbi:MAG: ABC transporter ATP-binding protein [Chloroflexota bacterium]|nr:MAG: ABC transporter ATP-binding protein [Chloroflexota bacterium]
MTEPTNRDESARASAEQTRAALPVIEMKQIVKRFPGVLANDHVDFDLRQGEIHALLGENGAGKSTLTNILAGLYRADQGEIFINGQRADIGSPRDAISYGIGMIYQHFMLVPSQTVTENIILGLKEPRFILNLPQAEKRVAELSKQFGLKVDPRAHIWQLSVGEQQRVEILKMLYRGANVLILDEPTAVLTPIEARELFATLHSMTAQGRSVIFISHHLDEILEIADRVTVMQKGRVTAAGVSPQGMSKNDLARLMVGREIVFALEKKKMAPGDVVLDVEKVRALNDRGLPALQNLSLQVRANEILGIAGVAGNGQRELSQVITGLRPVVSGHIRLGAYDLNDRTPGDIFNIGVGHVPEDRLGTGLASGLDVMHNLILRRYKEPPIARGISINWNVAHKVSENLITTFDISTPSENTRVGTLSGGNTQKVILAREISTRPDLLVAVHPTRGLDVGATEAVQKLLLQQREQGAAILLISEDLDELLAVSDRIAVIFDGQIIGEMPAENADIEKIGLMMAGTK